MSDDIFSQLFNLFNNDDGDVNWNLASQINNHINKDSKESFLFSNSEMNYEEIFRAIDTDDSGYIDPDEFRDALQKLVGDFPEEFLQNLMQHFDTDGDGKINLEELLNLLAFVD